MSNSSELGYLGFPIEPVFNTTKIVENLAFSIPKEIFSSFRNSDEGLRIKKKLRNQFQIAENQVTRFSQSIGGNLKFNDFYNWYVYYANLNTEEVADKVLGTYLESGSFEGLLCLWISGVHISTTVDIGDNFKISQISELPVSSDRERYRLEAPDFLYFQPECAITTTVRLNKNHEIDNNHVFSPQYEKLLEICRILNLICNSPCTPTLQSFYPLDCPVSFLTGGGLLFPQTPNLENLTLLGTDKIDELILLQKKIEEKTTDIRDLINRSLYWYGKAKTELDINDKFLSLAVALEMLLLKTHDKSTDPSPLTKWKNIKSIFTNLYQKNEHPRLSKSFVEHGMKWVGDDHKSKKIINDKLSDIYKIRSSVAHKGKMTIKRTGKSGKKYKYAKYSGNKNKNWDILFTDYSDLAKTIIKKSILEEFPPNWDNL